MLFWICPDCGHECSPAIRECPTCAEATANGAAGIQVVEQSSTGGSDKGHGIQTVAIEKARIPLDIPQSTPNRVPSASIHDISLDDTVEIVVRPLLESIEQQAAEDARRKREADEAERVRLEAAEQARREREAEEARLHAEAEERARLQRETEEARLRAEAEEQVRREREAEEARLRAEAEEQARREREAEEARLRAEAEERARLEREAEEAEMLRLQAEEAERLHLEAIEQARREREAEEARLRVEAEERARLQREAEEAEKLRLEAEEAERLRLEAEEQARQERAAEEARMRAEAEERARLQREAEEAERLRLEAEEAERLRLEAIEQARQEREAEEARLRAEAEERARLQREAEEAEQLRLQAEEAERLRLAAEDQARREHEAEEARLRAEAAERARLQREAEEAELLRLQAEEAELLRLAAEEAARLAAIQAEQAAIREIAATFEEQSVAPLLAPAAEIVTAPAPPSLEWIPMAKPDIRPCCPPDLRIESLTTGPQGSPAAGPCFPRELTNLLELSPVALTTKRRVTLPAWALSVVLAIAVFLATGIALQYLTANRDAKAAPVAPAQTATTAATAPAQAVNGRDTSKFLEVAGMRVVTGWNHRRQLHYVVVNHSSDNLPGMMIQIAVRSADAASSSLPLFTVNAAIPALGSYQSKEVHTDLDSSVSPSSVADWQSLRAEVQVVDRQ